jgi:hypothetical protein
MVPDDVHDDDLDYLKVRDDAESDDDTDVLGALDHNA